MGLRFSIVVPVYNVEEYLAACIDSILAQKRDDYEVILVDDGSTDASAAICDRYAREHDGIVQVLHKPNEGLLLARRSGFEKARGEYVISVDSDDMLLPGALDAIDAALLETDADVVYYQMTRDETEVKRLCTSASLGDGDEADAAATRFSLQGKASVLSQLSASTKLNAMWAKAVRRTCLGLEKDYSPFKGISYGEDFLQTLEIFDRAERFCFLDETLYFYRPSATSMTRDYDPRYYQQISEYFDIAKSYAENWESRLGVKGLLDGFDSLRLDALVTHALYFVESNDRDSLKRLSDSEEFRKYSALQQAKALLRPDRRLAVFFIEHRLYRLFRIEAMLRLKFIAHRAG